MKIRKIILINIFLLVLFLLIIEFAAFLLAKKSFHQFLNFEKYHYNIDLRSAEDEMQTLMVETIRRPVGLNFKKKSIILFGCSYTYGHGLEENQTLSTKLSNYAKRPVFNRGLPACGIQHMYWQLNSGDVYNDVTIEPEYIIYFLPYFNIDRLCSYIFKLHDPAFYLRYFPDKLDENGDLREQKPFLPKYLNGLYTVRIVEEIKTKSINKQKLETFARFIFNKSREKALKHYPNAKFVIFGFNTNEYENRKNKELLELLKQDGFTIIYQEDLTDIRLDDKKWQISEDDIHPNEAFWDYMTPLIAKELNL